MRLNLLRHCIRLLRLRPTAPFPSEELELDTKKKQTVAHFKEKHREKRSTPRLEGTKNA